MDFADAITEIEQALESFTIPIEEIVGSAGGETKGTQRLRRALGRLGWPKTVVTLERFAATGARLKISSEPRLKIALRLGEN